MSERRQYRKRTSLEPILRDGHIQAIDLDLKPSPVRINILKTLAHEQPLPSRWIAPLAGTTEAYLAKEMPRLKNEPNRYVKLPDVVLENPNAYMNSPNYYELTEKGAGVLEDLGFTVPEYSSSRQLKHKLQANEMMGSFKIGAVEHKDKVRLHLAADIRNLPAFPEGFRYDTRRSIPLQDPDNPKEAILTGKDKIHAIIPDSDFFAIKSLTTGKFCFIFGNEADTGTEAIKAWEFDTSRIAGKIRSYVWLIDHRIYWKRFGARTAFVHFSFRTHRRQKSVMENIAKWMPEKYRPHFRFTTHTSTPDGSMMSRDWDVIGSEPFNYLKF